MTLRSRIGLATLAIAALLGAGAGRHWLTPHSIARGSRNSAEPERLSRTSAAEALRALPLRFEPNVGQFAPEIRFGARGAGFDVGLGSRTAWLSFHGADRIALHFRVGEGDSKSPRIEGVGKLSSVSNYLIGENPAGWHTDIPNFGAVRLKGVYPGIDVLFHGGEGRLEYDFEVAAGADPSRIRLVLDGAETLRVDRDGELVVNTHSGVLRQPAPPIFARRGLGERQSVLGQYRVDPTGEVGVVIPSRTAGASLLIDPVIDYSTYLAGSANGDYISAVAIDGHGGAYVTGSTNSPDFPLQDPLFPTYLGGSEFGNAFVAKFTPSGSALVFSTYLGGTGGQDGGEGDYGRGIAVSVGGSVYVVGETNSADFPVTENGFQPTLNGPLNAFLSVLTPTGDALQYSTFLGGSMVDGASGLALDPSGRAYICGGTSSPDFPLRNAIQPTVPAGSTFTAGFLSGIDPSLLGDASLFVSTYLGLTDSDANAVQVDGQGRIYVAGSGAPQQSVIDGQDAGPWAYGALLYRLVDAGTAIDYAVTIGGTTFTSASATALAVDAAGAAYIAGTPDFGFPTTPNAFQTTPPFPEILGFVAKRSADGSSWEYASYFGCNAQTSVYGISVDPVCDGGCVATVVGTSLCTDFPVVDPVAAWADIDAGVAAALGFGFVSQLNAAGSGLVFSTPFYFFGVGAIAEEPGGDLFLAGWAGPPSMITADPFQATSPNSNGGPAVAKISLVAPPPGLSSIDPIFGPTSGDTSITVTGARFAAGATLTLGDAPATNVQINSPTELVAITTAHAPGIVDVTVTNSDGQMATLTKAFTYETSAEDAGDGGDGGDAGPDAGDAGPPDAGDAGSANRDGGADAGPPESSSGGCNCTHAAGPQETGFLLFVLAELARRRRRASTAEL